MTEFLNGKPVVYGGLDGALYTAQYLNGERNKLGVGSLMIKNMTGRVIYDVLMAEHKARTFFFNLDVLP